MLRRDGTLWLNYGDAYYVKPFQRYGAAGPALAEAVSKSTHKVGRISAHRGTSNSFGIGLKPKDLMGMPDLVSRQRYMRDGWWRR